MRIVVIGYDDDQQQAFWDVIPVGAPDSIEEGEERAKYRFARLRGDYADVVDVMTVERFVTMAHRIMEATEEEDEAAYRMLEEDAGVKT